MITRKEELKKLTKIQKQGKVDSAKIILENQMDNGSTLEQAADFVKNLKLISNKDLEKLIKIYK